MATIKDKLNNLKIMEQAQMDGDVIEQKERRDKKIVCTSIIGVIANIFLAGFKAVIGLMTASIAIVMDAVNNISDAASSVITIIGTKLAGKEPDKQHPFGHGRAEYMSALLISVLVLYAGLTSLIESIKKIMHPDIPEYTGGSLVIVAVAVLVKILLGRYVKAVGVKVNSDPLINSGEDAKMDSIISASTLVAAIIYLNFGLSLEAWLGAVISLVIIKSSVDMLRDTVSKLLGEKGDYQLALEIKKTVSGFDNVRGVYDLVLNNYGPDAYNGSLHIEVPDTYTADQLDQLIRNITLKVFEKHRVLLTAVGVYSVNTKDPEVARIREDVKRIVLEHKHALQVHGFYLNQTDKTMRFDVVISFDAGDRAKLYRHIVEDVEKSYPEYKAQISLDTDFSEA